MLSLFPTETTLEELESPLFHALSGVDVDARPYQSRIIHKAYEMFAGTHRGRSGEEEPAASSILIESPTGSGKTVMGLAIARHMQHVYGYRVGWVAMRRNLLTQAARKQRARLRPRHADDLDVREKPAARRHARCR